MDKISEEEVGGELNGYFPDVFGGAFVLFPYVCEVLSGDEGEVMISDFGYGVSYDSSDPGSVFHVVEFVLGMGVEGVGELAFPAVCDVEAVFVG